MQRHEPIGSVLKHAGFFEPGSCAHRTWQAVGLVLDGFSDGSNILYEVESFKRRIPTALFDALVGETYTAAGSRLAKALIPIRHEFINALGGRFTGTAYLFGNKIIIVSFADLLERIKKKGLRDAFQLHLAKRVRVSAEGLAEGDAAGDQLSEFGRD